MQDTTLSLSIEDHIAHLTLVRGEALNSLNAAFWREFPRVLDDIDCADDVRVVVLSSTGKHFSAGMDLDIFRHPDPRLFSGEAGRRGEFVRRLVLELQACFTRLESLRMPVLAAVQGGCIGGALDLVCACDCRYATADAFFTVKETRLGMVADLGTLQRLPRLVPPGLARELVYSGRHLPADEAQQIGLLNQVFSDQDSMMNAVMGIAREIAAQSPLAVHGCKEVLNYSRDHSVQDGLHYTATWQAGMFQSADLLESVTAKAQQRPAAYQALHPAGASMTARDDC